MRYLSCYQTATYYIYSMKGNTKERVLLQYYCEIRLAPNHALYVTSYTNLTFVCP